MSSTHIQLFAEGREREKIEGPPTRSLGVLRARCMLSYYHHRYIAPSKPPDKNINNVVSRDSLGVPAATSLFTPCLRFDAFTGRVCSHSSALSVFQEKLPTQSPALFFFHCCQREKLFWAFLGLTYCLLSFRPRTSCIGVGKCRWKLLGNEELQWLFQWFQHYMEFRSSGDEERGCWES